MCTLQHDISRQKSKQLLRGKTHIMAVYLVSNKYLRILTGTKVMYLFSKAIQNKESHENKDLSQHWDFFCKMSPIELFKSSMERWKFCCPTSFHQNGALLTDSTQSMYVIKRKSLGSWSLGTVVVVFLGISKQCKRLPSACMHLPAVGHSGIANAVVPNAHQDL